ncbi:hypothetical protein OESDEN_17612 [Oesophagostomum dentatum]|uniref:FERM domain-containing protein n=1 Tax=Oesophagostomum dentatum TaxID=61180 RepID=A0A0B1SBN6_OESDE|nr:hypothetical protein OESDEN_17612 [Oesophagostomum dentatum]
MSLKTKTIQANFRFYEATKFSGPPLPRNDVIVAVNWTGIYVVDDQEHVLLEFSFPEVTRVSHQKGPRAGFDTCTIKTVTGDEYSFQSPNAEDVRDLVSTFIDGLKERSRYLVATKPQKGDDASNLLEFECGDLLVLTNKATGKDLLKEKGPRAGFDTCTIKTVTGDEYSFQSPNAEDVRDLVSTFIDGLKERSRYLVATKPQKGDDASNLLEFECGDLLVLTNKATGKDLLKEKFVKVGFLLPTCKLLKNFLCYYSSALFFK